jgi:hypothetical protein
MTGTYHNNIVFNWESIHWIKTPPLKRVKRKPHSVKNQPRGSENAGKPTKTKKNGKRRKY